jgi:hypothetical protein
MKILHVHERATFHGGVEQILHDTAQGLSGRGWQQALLHSHPDTDSAFLAPFTDASTRQEIFTRFNPDVVLLHKVADAELVKNITLRHHAVRMVHDHDLVCLRRHKYFPLSGRICSQPAGWHCYSNLCFLNRNTAAKGLPVESQTEILYVGQIIRGKGVDLLLRALARVPQPWHATIVGTGNHLEHCRHLADTLGIARHVKFTGWVSHPDLEPYYAKATFTVVPSRWPEPFGMVGVEAMARGRAVVGFSSGGIPDWLDSGVNGVLAPAGDVAQLADSISALLADPEHTRNLGRRAAQLTAEKFTHARYLEEMQTLLEEVA